jgi:hypothetical protein
MLEFICSIPNWLGWTFVGVVGIACVFMSYLLAQTIITMIRERMEDEEEED